ncbi:hypothetical protein ACFQ46_22230 [Kineococcus sp. GCM10028916]|uniref:hypothetical protein n=1 Tax=Kineococcus sp. GCM10028916 TaxID=3273394 RepID=UPI00363BC125
MDAQTPEHADLPLPDYDHLPLATLQHRIRTLDADALAEVTAYEEAHARRLPVLSRLRERAAQFAQGAGPSGGDPAAPQPEHAPPAEPAPTAVTPGPPVNPPSQGVPTNPAQPRR